MRLGFALGGEALLARYARAAPCRYRPISAGKGGGDAQDRHDYQTVFARREAGRRPDGIAAPDPSCWHRWPEAGIRRCFVTLHVGPGTFAR